MCNVKRAVMGLGIITLCAFIINTPHFATYELVPDSERNASDPAFRLSAYGSGSGSMNYEFWVHCMFLVLAPWATIFVLNMLIIQRVFKMNRQMDSKRGSSGKEKAKKSEQQLTRLLLTVTFTFLVLIAFQCITQCFFMLKAVSAQQFMFSRRKRSAYLINELDVVILQIANRYLNIPTYYQHLVTELNFVERKWIAVN